MTSTFTKLSKYVLALLLLVFGLDKLFFEKLPHNEFYSSYYIEGLSHTMIVVGVVEVIIALLLLFNKWVPFALLLLAPISINILLAHLFLGIPYVGLALIVLVINVILIYKHWHLYKPLFI